MNKPFPKTMEIEIHFHAPRYGDELIIFTQNMSHHGYPYLGFTTVTVDVPEADPVKAEIDMLEMKAEQVRQDLGNQLENINRRISELTALEYKPEDSDSE